MFSFILVGFWRSDFRSSDLLPLMLAQTQCDHILLNPLNFIQHYKSRQNFTNLFLLFKCRYVIFNWTLLKLHFLNSKQISIFRRSFFIGRVVPTLLSCLTRLGRSWLETLRDFRSTFRPSPSPSLSDETTLTDTSDAFIFFIVL
jgi:hypothetical protein